MERKPPKRKPSNLKRAYQPPPERGVWYPIGVLPAQKYDPLTRVIVAKDDEHWYQAVVYINTIEIAGATFSYKQAHDAGYYWMFPPPLSYQGATESENE